MALVSDVLFWIELVLLTVYFTIGLQLVYTDLKFRVVSNRYILILMGVGLTGQMSMIFLDIVDIGSVLATFVWAFVIAYGLMIYGFWAPGDGKLFWSTVIIIPPTLCFSDDFWSLEAVPLVLLFNTLIPLLLLLLVRSFWRRELLLDKHKNDKVDAKELIQVAVGMIALLGGCLALSSLLLNRPLSDIEIFGVLLVSYQLLGRLNASYWPIILLPGCASLVYLLYTGTATKTHLLLWLAASGVELLLLHLGYWHRHALVRVSPIYLLQAGSVPRSSIFLHESEGKPICLLIESGEGERICIAGQVLSESEVHRLRDLVRLGAFPEGASLEVEQSIPFVPFIILGCLLTVLFSRNIVQVVAEKLGWIGIH